jgi:HD-like signal output (HDOD) protein
MSVDAPEDLGINSCEREVMGFDHGAVGVALARKWGLPRSLQECIEFHHDPQLAKEYPIDAAIVHIANSVAVLAEIGSTDLGDALAILPDALRATRLDSAGVVETVLKTMESAPEMLAVLGGAGAARNPAPAVAQAL